MMAAEEARGTWKHSQAYRATDQPTSHHSPIHWQTKKNAVKTIRNCRCRTTKVGHFRFSFAPHHHTTPYHSDFVYWEFQTKGKYCHLLCTTCSNFVHFKRKLAERLKKWTRKTAYRHSLHMAEKFLRFCSLLPGGCCCCFFILFLLGCTVHLIIWEFDIAEPLGFSHLIPAKEHTNRIILCTLELYNMWLVSVTILPIFMAHRKLQHVYWIP